MRFDDDWLYRPAGIDGDARLYRQSDQPHFQLQFWYTTEECPNLLHIILSERPLHNRISSIHISLNSWLVHKSS
jgi:hypothetical protein